MSVSSNWGAFDAAMRAYVEEFAALSMATPVEFIPMPRWVERNGRYVRDTGKLFTMAQSVSNSAFHIDAFKALERIFYESPLKRHLAGGAAADSCPHVMVHPRDVAFRLACRAVKVEMDGSQNLDRQSMEADIGYLHELVDAKTLPMELIGVVLGARAEKLVKLRDDLRVESLTAPEIGPFLDSLPFPMTINKATQEWEVLLPAPVALMRLDFEQPWDQPWLDPSNDLRAEFERFADCVALYYDARPVLFLERRWHRREFMRGWWNDTVPQGIGLVEKTAVITDGSPVVEACSALRKLAFAPGKSAVPLAIRRLGLTRTRNSEVDVLIDAVIALEALLLERSEREGLGLRMATRASAWAAELGEDPSAIFPLVKRAYGMRSDIVHGETPKETSTYKIGETQLSYASLVLRVANLGRRFGAEALRRVLDGSYDQRRRVLLDLGVNVDDSENVQ